MWFSFRWADSKLRSRVSSAKEARESVVSDYYTAIDDRHVNIIHYMYESNLYKYILTLLKTFNYSLFMNSSPRGKEEAMWI